jgi:hypothetical protein
MGTYYQSLLGFRHVPTDDEPSEPGMLEYITILRAQRQNEGVSVHSHVQVRRNNGDKVTFKELSKGFLAT